MEGRNEGRAKLGHQKQLVGDEGGSGFNGSLDKMLPLRKKPTFREESYAIGVGSVNGDTGNSEGYYLFITRNNPPVSVTISSY